MRSEAEPALIAQARHDRAAFAALYDLYVTRVYAFCAVHSTSREDAEDLTAQTFERALHAISHYEERGQPFSAWLLRIAAHAAGALAPTVSLAAPPHGVPYAGHVRLSTTVPLSTHAFSLQAFRLVSPTTVATPERVARLARQLSIHAPIQRTTRGRVAWLVAAERGAPSSRLRRSVAVSLVTGELVYHDTSYPRQERWWDNAYAVSAARAWLTRLGWPGARMPLTAVEHSGIPRGLREIELTWLGVGAAATDAATLWLTPGGRVVEADVWPPVESVRTIPARKPSAAWTALRGRLVPLAVVGVPPNTTAPGVGVMRHVTITYVLSTGTDRRLYLVPTYHFAGSARLRGIHGEHICYALAPAAQPRTTT